MVERLLLHQKNKKIRYEEGSRVFVSFFADVCTGRRSAGTAEKI